MQLILQAQRQYGEERRLSLLALELGLGRLAIVTLAGTKFELAVHEGALGYRLDDGQADAFGFDAHQSLIGVAADAGDGALELHRPSGANPLERSDLFQIETVNGRAIVSYADATSLRVTAHWGEGDSSWRFGGADTGAPLMIAPAGFFIDGATRITAVGPRARFSALAQRSI